ncbi:hypothetical protein IT407_01465 [Candidatus Uhrbacteria bacterium]|nr:hypothetical protein [Candidatus Uhrbacteria bacterium]
MIKLDTLNRGELFNELSELARAQGTKSKSEWRELVDEVLDSHLEDAELDPDGDLEGLETVLTDMWETYEATAGEETKSQIDEDPEAPHA